MKTTLKKETIQFLKDIRKNNNREWFNVNKEKFMLANENFLQFVQALIDTVSKFDKSVAGLEPKDCVFRIYRDTRFSKDKTPYKTHFGAHLMGNGESCGVAGYYFHFEPGASFLAGGVHMTEPTNLKTIREEISSNGARFKKIISDRAFKENLTLEGEKLKNIPQGFDKEDPMGDYLKYKELMIKHNVADKEISSDNFSDYCGRIFKTMMPFNNFVNEPVMSLR